MKKKTKWMLLLLWIVPFVLGMAFTIWGIVDMYAFEIQDGHETLRDAMLDARYATRGKWITGIILMVLSYIGLYVPLKKI